VAATADAPRLQALQSQHREAFERKRAAVQGLTAALDGGNAAAVDAAAVRVRTAAGDAARVRDEAKALIAASGPRADANDADYIFLSFVMSNLPRGLVGLLLAVILCAAMSSTASELTALGGCTVVDFYRRSLRPSAPDAHYVHVAKLATGAWGVLAVLFAAFAGMVDNLIQAVNILGSLFYGTILGIFLAAFFAPRLRATPVFVAAIISEFLVFALWLTTGVGFLWFNLIGCVAVLVFAHVLGGLGRRDPRP
jgi:Na+/proline symporter